MKTKTKRKHKGKLRSLPKYPWDRWFAKARFTLQRGKDYDCLPHGMASQIRNEAVRRRRSVSIAITEGMLAVTINGRIYR